MESDSSENNLVIITKRDRVKLFCKLYWRTLIMILTPLVALPIVLVNEKCAYKCFYIFIISCVYWITDVLHPSITALVPLALYSIIDIVEKDSYSQNATGYRCLLRYAIAPQSRSKRISIMNELLDCLGVMMLIVAIEYSEVNRRVAIKILLLFGCSHYRLSFLIFFTTMLLSMWMSDIVACGLMMPLMNAILLELEKMGIIEVYLTISKAKQTSLHHEESKPRPTDFTIFYFLGIAYSSSIGGMATIGGSHVNQIFVSYSEILFPSSPKIEFPHFMLLNLPGVLLMETLLYLWLNSYFMGMFRAQSSIALEIGMSEEEAQYIKTLLTTQYGLLGKIKFHECIVCLIVILTGVMEISTSAAHIAHSGHPHSHSHIKTAAACIVCAILLFIVPTKLDFLNFFKIRTDANREPLPQSPSKACLNWKLVKHNIHWSVLFTIGGSCFIFEALKDSKMTMEIEKFLLVFRNWPPAALVFVVIVFCKTLTEFASNPCVTYCLLPNIARVSVQSNVNPHYLMMAASLSCSLPFHLITGSPSNAMVATYVYIPPRKMLLAGIGPSIITMLVTWLTVAVWSQAVWIDITLPPDWAHDTTLKFNQEN